VANQTVRAIDPDCEATMILTPLDNMNRSENIFFATLSSTVRSNLAFSQIKLRDTEEKLTPGPAILYFATAFSRSAADWLVASWNTVRGGW